MFTRSELEIMTVAQLRDLCREYGLRPTGNPSYKASYIVSLMAFADLALKQLKEGKGLRNPSFAMFQNIGVAVDEMEEPTDEQAALIRITMKGSKMRYPERYDQERLMNLYKAKLLLEQAIDLLQ